jgi:hypothetical protein
MSAMIATAAVGTAFSIYSGIKQGQAAKAAQAQAQNAINQQQGIAQEVRAQQDALAYNPLKAQEAQDQSSALSPGAQMALDRFKADQAQTTRQIQASAPTVGQGVAQGRLLTQQFRNAQGIAAITLGDTAQKQANLRSDIQIGAQTPGWANLATGANTQNAQFQTGLMQEANQNEMSAYGAAAQGLAGLAKAYAGSNSGSASPGNAALGNADAMATRNMQPTVMNNPFGQDAPPPTDGIANIPYRQLNPMAAGAY